MILECERIEFVDGKTREQFQAVRQHPIGVDEGERDLILIVEKQQSMKQLQHLETKQKCEREKIQIAPMEISK